MGFLCLINMFTMRVSLNVAIVEMVNETSIANVNDTYVDPDACPEPFRATALRWLAVLNDTDSGSDDTYHGSNGTSRTFAASPDVLRDTSDKAVVSKCVTNTTEI